MKTTYTIAEVIERLKSRKYYLKSLPSYQCTNFGMFYSEAHDIFYRSDVSSNSPAIGDIYKYNHDQVIAFLARAAKERHFTDYEFAPIADMHDELHLLEDYVAAAAIILRQLEANKEQSFIVSYLDFHLFSMPMIGWYAINNSDNGGYYEFFMDANRALQEVVNVLQKNPSAQCGDTIDGPALKRWQYTVNWIKQSFPYGKQPGVYYMVYDHMAITYLENGQAIHVNYGKTGDKRKVIEALHINAYKHSEYVKSLLKEMAVFQVLKEDDQIDKVNFEFIIWPLVFKTDTLVQLIQSESISLRGGVHINTYNLTTDRSYLHSHILNENYPLVEKLEELIDKGAMIEISTIRRKRIPTELLVSLNFASEDPIVQLPFEAPMEQVEMTQHTEEMSLAEPVKSYDITENWGLKIIKGTFAKEGCTLVQMHEKETDLALRLHEALTGVALKLVSTSQIEGGEESTFGFGSRLLIATAITLDSICETKWNYKTLSEDLMLTLKTSVSEANGLNVEINAFVDEDVLGKITQVLDSL